MTYDEELRMFKKWLRKQNLNPLAELYALVLFGTEGMEAVKKWLYQE